MMSSNISIKIKNIEKFYYIGSTKFQILLNLLGFKNEYKKFFALKNINIEILRGEIVGIIGENGSGKSTLLKIISGIIPPSNGTCEVFGNVVSIIELGVGFNPEFSGIDNIFILARYYNFSDQNINAKLDEIIQFADIGDNIFQPIKNYSSGMSVRLAFAICINLDPNILIIDEALAVGDIGFQSKCYAKLKKLNSEGVTIVFVSHDIGSIRAMSDKVLWLHRSTQIDYGPTRNVCDNYLSTVYGFDLQTLENNNEAKYDLGFDYGTKNVMISNYKLVNQFGEPLSNICIGEDIIINFNIVAEEEIQNIVFGYAICDLKGTYVVGSLSSNYSKYELYQLEKNSSYEIEIRLNNNLAYGSYTIMLCVEKVINLNKQHEHLHVLKNILPFHSIYNDNPYDIIHSLVRVDTDFLVRKNDF